MSRTSSRALQTPSKPAQPLTVAVDLFCGVGGKSHGFLRAGIPVSMGVDIDSSCRFAYEFNNAPAKFLERSVADLSPSEVAKWFPPGAIRVLIGCTPCQPFSVYSYRYGAADGKRRSRDKRWGLLQAYQRLVEGVLPEIVSVENVPQLALLKHRVYLAFIERLQELGYFVCVRVVRCADYGIPQTRTRLVILASRLGPISLLPPTHSEKSWVTVKDAIGDLPPIHAGAEGIPEDSLHKACRLSPLNLRRVKATPEGGGWTDWPKSLRLACHRKKSGATYPSVYGRMSWDGLAPTLTTQCYGLGNGRFGHPSQHRAISLREAALLQTFPRDYQFVPPGERPTFKHVGKHIGNAVPVRLGEVIAQSIKAHLAAVQLQAPPDTQSSRRIAQKRS